MHSGIYLLWSSGVWIVGGQQGADQHGREDQGDLLDVEDVHGYLMDAGDGHGYLLDGRYALLYSTIVFRIHPYSSDLMPSYTCKAKHKY